MNDSSQSGRASAIRPLASATVPAAVAIIAATVVSFVAIRTGTSMVLPGTEGGGSPADSRSLRPPVSPAAPQRIGGGADGGPDAARTHRLHSPDARATARVITSLVDALGGEADVREVGSGAAQRLRLELSVPQENSAYLLSRLESLGQITPAPPEPQVDAERYALSMELVGAQ
jgi:hypothetical protein